MKPLKGGLTTPPRGGEHIILISCDWCGHYIQPFICDASQGVGWLNKYSLGQVRLGQGWLSKYSLGQLLNTRIQITIGLILESLYFMHNNTLGLWPQCYSIIYRPVHKSFHAGLSYLKFMPQGCTHYDARFHNLSTSGLSLRLMMPIIRFHDFTTTSHLVVWA